MDEFKQKLMGLLSKQVTLLLNSLNYTHYSKIYTELSCIVFFKPPKIPSMGFDDSNYHSSQMPTLCINSKTAQDPDRPADQDILESIEAAYFASSESFDICRFELMVSFQGVNH